VRIKAISGIKLETSFISFSAI